MIKKVIFFVLISMLSATQVFAGGGQIRPISFKYDQVILGRSLDVEIEVRKNDLITPAVGEEFKIVAHNDLSNASCETTQRITDSNGRVKGFCKAEAYGRFLFDLIPVSTNYVKYPLTFVVHFSENQSETGYSDKTNKSIDNYEAVIVQNPNPVAKNERFTLEVKLKKDNNLLSDISNIQKVRWYNLKGSYIRLDKTITNNQKINILVESSGTVMVADVILSSGEQLKTASKLIQVKNDEPLKATASTSYKEEKKQEASSVSANEASVAAENVTSLKVEDSESKDESILKRMLKYVTHFLDWLSFWN